jgi:hypothetical protein
MGVYFMLDEEPSLILKPAYRAFDLHAFEASPQGSSVLTQRFLLSFAIWSHLFYSAARKNISQPIRVGGFVRQQSGRTLLCHAKIHQRFDVFTSASEADVVFDRRRFGHEDRLINMRATPFALKQLQISCH